LFVGNCKNWVMVILNGLLVFAPFVVFVLLYRTRNDLDLVLLYFFAAGLVLTLNTLKNEFRSDSVVAESVENFTSITDENLRGVLSQEERVILEEMRFSLRHSLWGPKVSKAIWGSGFILPFLACIVLFVGWLDDLVLSIAWILCHGFLYQGYRLLRPIQFVVIPGEVKIVISWFFRTDELELAKADLAKCKAFVNKKSGILELRPIDDSSNRVVSWGLAGVDNPQLFIAYVAIASRKLKHDRVGCTYATETLTT